MFYFIYSLIFFIVGLILSTQQKIKTPYLVFYYLGIVLFWGLSYIDAADTPSYIDKFYYGIQTIPGYIDTQYELGYTITAMVCKTIYPHYWLYQFFIFGVEVFLIFKGVRYFFDDRTFLAIIPLLFFVYPTNVYAFRQGIAASIFIYALQYINAETVKKSLLYLLFIAIAVLFHQSAIMLVLIYPIRFAKRFFSYNWVVLGILFLGDLIWVTGSSISSKLEFLMSFFFNDSMTMGEKYVAIYESGSMNGAFGLAKVIEINIGVILYTLFCKNDKDNELLRFNLLIFVIAALYIGGFVGHRLNYYWTILYYVCFLRGLLAISDNNSKTRILIFLLLAIYMFWFYIFWCDYYNDKYTFLFNF